MPEIKGNTRGKSSSAEGLYRARVEDNKDPMQLGRIRVRVPGFHGIPGNEGALEKDMLPWASYASISGGGYEHGSFIMPEIGDYVYLLFECNDPDKPVYIAGSYGTQSTISKQYNEGSDAWSAPTGETEIPSEAKDSPNKKVIYKSPKGAIIMIDENAGKESITIMDRVGQTIVMKSPVEGAFSRREGSQSDNTGIKPTGEAGIFLYDASGQVIEMQSNEGASRIRATNYSGVVLELDSDRNAIVMTGGTSLKVSPEGIHIVGDVRIHGKLTVEKDLQVNGNAKVSGDQEVNNITVSNKVRRHISDPIEPEPLPPPSKEPVPSDLPELSELGSHDNGESFISATEPKPRDKE